MRETRTTVSAPRSRPAEDFLGFQPQDVERLLHRAQRGDGDPFADDIALSAGEAAVLRGAWVALSVVLLLATAAAALTGR